MKNPPRTPLVHAAGRVAGQQTWSGRGLATIPRGGMSDGSALAGGNARHEVGEAWDKWSRGRDRSTPAFCMTMPSTGLTRIMMCDEKRGEDL